MRGLRRHRLGLLSLVCVVVGGVFLLLALDAHTWQRTVARDDLRFRALPSHRGLWRPQTVLPGDPAGALLNTGATLANRRAVQLFWYSRVGINPEERQDLPTLRATTQQHLEDLAAGASARSERSYASNLLGVLVVTTPTTAQDKDGIRQVLARAAGYFQQAIQLDSQNNDAKLNLELVLRVTLPGKGPLGKDARSGYGSGLGRGVKVVGGGY